MECVHTQRCFGCDRMAAVHEVQRCRTCLKPLCGPCRCRRTEPRAGLSCCSRDSRLGVPLRDVWNAYLLDWLDWDDCRYEIARASTPPRFRPR